MCFYYVFIIESYPISIKNIGYGILTCIEIIGTFFSSYIV
jgi:hypothetical protein